VITSEAWNTGRGGSVILEAGELVLRDGGIVTVTAFGPVRRATSW